MLEYVANPFALPLAWWRGAVIYQIYPRSFADSNADGVGDLRGILARLEYVASLGVDGIWISPFFRSPMADFGYDIEDYLDVDPLFGTLEDFDQLLRRAHDLGLRVVIDLVLSHTSERHAWFEQSRRSREGPFADWYVWADPRPDGTPPNNWLSVFGGVAWTWETRRRQYYLHNFLEAQPDLNLHHPPVQDALLAAARFWLDRGVDGFRLDAANFYLHDEQLRDNPPWPADRPRDGDGWAGNPYYMQAHVYDKSQPQNLRFLRRVRELLDSYPGERLAVAEIGDDDPVARTAEYVGAGLLHTAYNFALLGDACSAGWIRCSLEAFEAADPLAWPSWSFSNHDVARVASRWAKPIGGSLAERSRLLLALVCSLRGTIFLYQGEELGLPQAQVPFERIQDPYGIRFWPEFQGRDGCRTPMPWKADLPVAGFTAATDAWLPVPGPHLALAVDAQSAQPDSPLRFTQALLAWRSTVSALRAGGLRFLPAPEPLLAFRREDAQGTVLAVFNLGPGEVTLEPEGLAAADLTQGFSQRARVASGVLHLGAQGFLIAALGSGAPG